MNFVFDACVIILMILFVVVGIKKGLVKAAAEFLGSIVSALLAAWAGAYLSELIYNTMFRESIMERITESMGSAQGAEAVAGVFANLPDFVVRLFNSNGVTESTVAEAVTGGTQNMAAVVTDALSPLFISIIKVFVVIILFVLFMIIIRALAALVSKICKLPVLHQLNSALGGVFGLLCGTVIIWVVLGAISFFEPMMDSATRQSFDDTMDSSYVTKTVASLNPVKWIYYE